VRERMGHPAW